MKLAYLETSDPGLRWMRSYYRRNPQLNRSKFLAALKRAEQTLCEFPMSGERFQDFGGVREYPIQGTAFSLLYTVSRETVWVIDIRDQRGLRSAEALRMYNRELRQRYGLL